MRREVNVNYTYRGSFIINIIYNIPLDLGGRYIIIHCERGDGGLSSRGGEGAP